MGSFGAGQCRQRDHRDALGAVGDAGIHPGDLRQGIHQIPAQADQRFRTLILRQVDLPHLMFRNAQLRQLFQQALIIAGGIGIFLPDGQQLHRVPGFKGIPHHLHDGKTGGRGGLCPLPLVQHGVQLSLQRHGGDISLQHRATLLFIRSIICIIP